MFPPGYIIFKKDRKLGVKKSGGGVFILISSEIKLDTESNLKLVVVELKLKDQHNVKIGSFYRPPWEDDSYMEDLALTLDKIDPKNSGNI